MALPSTYLQVYGQIPDFFGKLQEGQAPAKFSQQHLKDIGFTSSNYRAFLPLLKSLGFLTADGTPTARYHAYRNRHDAPRVMAEALRDAYAELFFIKDPPTEKDRPLIEGKFKSVHNVADRPAELMARTFLALCKIADFSAAASHSSKPSPPEEYPLAMKSEPPKDQNDSHFEPKVKPSLHYNIQIHLPATKDVEVYNAIFKSLKEHLLE
ncbi:DUF5343 domain-containing protein [Mesorhizobium sp.]|uniref:DUF5343 domain-containing protein n=1 Tax=Mesorhizobium sp. TaxID=1871066 RepID=UPI000FE775B1|nr:DUF5343 domain-containing protein [Mesorhizobium sp.]RWC57036.1 MAG: hypothetical protein EOS56_22620 [Mesorhizobium sp.]RWC57709.1 MAG: hypothetical protein EOS29_24315 [Mesorhizobium sp.]